MNLEVSNLFDIGLACPEELRLINLKMKTINLKVRSHPHIYIYVYLQYYFENQLEHVGLSHCKT